MKPSFRPGLSVYGSCEKFLLDNGGEFANKKLINLAEQFRITIKTISGPDHPGQTVLLKDIISHYPTCSTESLMKLIAVLTIHYIGANVKNSLYNSHGFTPYQLSTGTNISEVAEYGYIAAFWERQESMQDIEGYV